MVGVLERWKAGRPPLLIDLILIAGELGVSDLTAVNGRLAALGSIRGRGGREGAGIGAGLEKEL